MKNCEVKTLDEIRREYILKVLDAVNWDFEKASNILNVSVSYLKKEIKQLKEIDLIKRSK
ncbi:MAG TPA: hypothetical protein PKW07_03185 [Syntrophorhabdaceae bacterium]|nr:hypothetical protein [Syntrophorhabdaceae bacterium]